MLAGEEEECVWGDTCIRYTAAQCSLTIQMQSYRPRARQM